MWFSNQGPSSNETARSLTVRGRRGDTQECSICIEVLSCNVAPPIQFTSLRAAYGLYHINYMPWDMRTLFLKIKMNFGQLDLWPFNKFSFNICVNNLFFILKAIAWSNLDQTNIFCEFSSATCGHLSFDKLIRVEHITVQFPLSVYRMYPLIVVYFYSEFA